MAEPKPKMIDDKLGGKVETFPPGSEKKANMLEIGYGMSKEKAETIIKQYEGDPQTWPYEEYEKAKAFMAALTVDPVKAHKEAFG